METRTKTNLKIFAMLFGLVLLSAFAFSGCIFNLNTPVISRDGAEFKWKAIENATSYEVVFTDVENKKEKNPVSTTETFINVSPYVSAGTWSIKVRAVTTDILRNNSGFSNVETFTVGEGLETPNNLEVKTEENDVVASWTTVIGATSYSVKVSYPDHEDVFVTSKTGKAALTESMPLGGIYTVSVQAIKNVDDSGFDRSDYSDTADYANTITLAAPKISSFERIGDSYRLSWNLVPQATSYNVSLLGVDTTYSSTSNNITIPESKLGKLAKVNGSYNKSVFQVGFVQAVSTSEYCNPSDFSNGKPYYGLTATKENFQSIKIDYFYSSMTTDNDDVFDFRADSQAEMNAIVKFAVFYRLDNYVFFKNFNGNSETALQNSYDAFNEIMNLERPIVSPAQEKIEQEMTYFTPSTPTLTAFRNPSGENKNLVQQKFKSISSYSLNPRSEDESFNEQDLPIFTREKSMNVYTSEQLFQAVQAGYKPIFVGDCGGKRVWQAALAVAEGILDDQMTDYEKTLAIFDWICYENVYDDNVVDISNMRSTWQKSYNKQTGEWKDATAKKNYYSVHNYKGWYAEGIFFDHQAVCDGISKAFSLLCGIEDIKAYKANGYAFNNKNSGHAWNKVFLDLNGDNTAECYGVDATWADYKVQGGPKEYLTHRYFLVTDSQLENTSGFEHHENYKLHNATTPFDYYAFTKITIGSNTYDMCTENQAEFDAVFAYMTTHFSHFEMKIKSATVILPTNWQSRDYSDPTKSEPGYRHVLFYKI